MTESPRIRTTQLSEHVIQLAVPTPTLPPSYETNTYLVLSEGQGVVVDAGSQDIEVLQSLVDQVRECGATHILALVATHYHRDHTQGLPFLQQAFTVPIFIHPLDIPGAYAEMQLETLDVREIPSTFEVGSMSMEIRHAPGHTHGHVHIRIAQDGVILVGDHLAGDGSVWIGPPDGHMNDYYAALDDIVNSPCHIAGPGHGAALYDAPQAARQLKARREAREVQIESWLQQRSATLQEIVDHLYGGTIAPEVMWVAKKTVQAHLLYMQSQHRIQRRYTEEGRFMYESGDGPGTIRP
jgi:endoribonuclease LACTB2